MQRRANDIQSSNIVPTVFESSTLGLGESKVGPSSNVFPQNVIENSLSRKFSSKIGCLTNFVPCKEIYITILLFHDSTEIRLVCKFLENNWTNHRRT